MKDLEALCRDHGLLAIYLFGSREQDGARLLAGEAVDREGSDIDIAVVFAGPPRVDRLPALQVALEDIFAPLRVDLVPVQRTDALFEFRAIDGTRVATSDGHRANLYELTVMRRAAELLPIQAELDRDRFKAVP